MCARIIEMTLRLIDDDVTGQLERLHLTLQKWCSYQHRSGIHAAERTKFKATFSGAVEGPPVRSHPEAQAHDSWSVS
jgi:hypothetical protein